MIKEIAKFDKDDLVKLKQFNTVVANGSFDLKGNAVIHAASLFQWFVGLEKKIDGAIKRQVLDSIPKSGKLGDKK